MDQSEGNGRPVRVVRLRTVVIVTATLVAIVVAIGFVHVVYGGKVGLKLCAKDGWTIQDTLVNVDDYIDKPLISMIDKAKVLRSMFACEVLTRPGPVDEPRGAQMFKGGKAALTKLRLKKYAYEAYPSWSAAHPDKACPGSISELNEYITGNNSNDAWGRPIKMMCGDSLPAGAKGIALSSAGEDGKDGTEDDLKSWEE